MSANSKPRTRLALYSAGILIIFGVVAFGAILFNVYMNENLSANSTRSRLGETREQDLASRLKQAV